MTGKLVQLMVETDLDLAARRPAPAGSYARTGRAWIIFS